MKEIKGDSLTIWKTFKSKRLYIKRKLNIKKKMDGWKHMFSYFFIRTIRDFLWNPQIKTV